MMWPSWKTCRPFTIVVERAGHRVVVHDDEFEPDARDVDWLEAVGERGWVVLTKDNNIRYRAVEFQALTAAKVRAFTEFLKTEFEKIPALRVR